MWRGWWENLPWADSLNYDTVHALGGPDHPERGQFAKRISIGFNFYLPKSRQQNIRLQILKKC